MRDLPLMNALAAVARPKIAVLHPQNLSNTVWAFATLGVAHRPLFEAISPAVMEMIGEFDLQGLANTLWAFASLVLANAPLLSVIASASMPTVGEEAPALWPGSSAAVTCFEAARYTNHLCQLVWGLSFAGGAVATELHAALLDAGRRLDGAYPRWPAAGAPPCAPSRRPQRRPRPRRQRRGCSSATEGWGSS